MQETLASKSELARVRLTAGWFAQVLRRVDWLVVGEDGLTIESPRGSSFVSWPDVQSVRRGRAEDAFIVVHSGGRRLVVPASTAGDRADALARMIAACADLEWMTADNPHIPPMAVRADAVAAYQRAFRTYSR
jgi:hypothetical protein